MSADITTLRVISSDATNVIFSSNDVTILNTSSATITIPSQVELSNSTPEEISDVGSPGISMAVSRSDHVHSASNLVLNGGNF